MEIEKEEQVEVRPKKRTKQEYQSLLQFWIEEESKKTQDRIAAAAAFPPIQAVAYDPERDPNRVHFPDDDAAPVLSTNVSFVPLGATAAIAADASQTTLPTMAPPLITCEAVLTEATYITRNLPGARAALIEMVGEGFLSIGIYVADHHSALLAMIKRYTNVPMSLADACLVRLAELHPKSLVMTLDSDFSVYRKNGRQRIGVLRP